MAKFGEAALTSFSCVSTYDWEIPRFSLLDCTTPVVQDFLVPFPYKLFKWRLILHPDGFDKKFQGGVSVFLTKLEPLEIVKATYSLGILDKDGQQVNRREFTLITFQEDGIGPGCAELVSKVWLTNYKDTYLPNDTLTIRCTIDLSDAFANRDNLERIEGEAIAAHGALGDFDRLLASELFTDFTIKIGSRAIKVHRGILAARSDVLAAMLSHDDVETATNTLEITDFEYDVVYEMLKYVYTGKSKVVGDSESWSWDLLRISEKYQLPGLKTICQKELILQLTPKNVVDSIKLAEFLHAEQLVESSINLIVQKRRSVRAYSNVEEELSEHPEILQQIKQRTPSSSRIQTPQPSTSASVPIPMSQDILEDLEPLELSSL